MRNWLHGGDLDGGRAHETQGPDADKAVESYTDDDAKKKNRGVVVHCKAGKGRSGTASCSYLIAEEGWTMEDALQRFTERRMRPNFGKGVSIPSQLRWITYVDRWTKGGKRYRDRAIEILEIHIWGLRNGVKLDVEGFADEGRRIQVFHTFKKEERLVIEGNPPESGIADTIWGMAGYKTKDETANETARSSTEPVGSGTMANLKSRGTGLIEKVSPPGHHTKVGRMKEVSLDDGGPSPASSKTNLSLLGEEKEPGGRAVIFRPKEPIRIPNCDVNISVERRNSNRTNIGLTMVSAVAHVWFNTFFEGDGPEQDGQSNQQGVFSIDWEAMDGIKGSSRKGIKALDKMLVKWRAVSELGDDSGEEVVEPTEGEEVPQAHPADWTGTSVRENEQKDLGLRVNSPNSAEVSKASSLKSVAASEETNDEAVEKDDKSIEGVKSGGPDGNELDEEAKD